MLCMNPSLRALASALSAQQSHPPCGPARPAISRSPRREKASQQRERIARDIIPLELKRKEREAQRLAEAKRITFRQAAERYHEAHAAGWTSAMYADEFLGSLERWAYAHIGDLDVAAISKDEVLRVLEQKLPRDGGTFWVKRAVTADRVRNRVREGTRLCGGARIPQRRQPCPLARLSRGGAARAAQARAGEAPGRRSLWRRTEAHDRPGRQCERAGVALHHFDASRLSEALGAKWDDEIDLEAAEWVIPKERMKSRREHLVPLSPQAVELLRGLYREEGNPFVFIGRTPGTAIAKATVMQSLRRTGRNETVHGFKIIVQHLGARAQPLQHHVIELSLAHSVGTVVERSYRRTDLAEQRRKLMEHWDRIALRRPPWRRGRKAKCCRCGVRHEGCRRPPRKLGKEERDKGRTVMTLKLLWQLMAAARS